MDSSSFKTSLGKKLIAVALCVTAFVFLSFSVFGTTYNPTTYNTFQDSVTYNGLTYSVRVTQLKAQSTGTSLLEAGQQTTMLVTLQLSNNNNSTVACTIPKLTIDCSDQRVITGVDTYGGDLTLSLLTGGTGVFLPNEEFAYQNNKIIVPPNSSLYCIGAIYLPAQLDQDGSGVLDTGLRGVHLYDKSNYQVTIGDYNYGTPVNMSGVIDAIEDLADTVATSAELQQLISVMTYSGNNPSVSLNNGTTRYISVASYGNLSGFVWMRHSPYIISEYDYEYNNSTDSAVAIGTKRVYFDYLLCIRNNINVIGTRYYHEYNILPNLTNIGMHVTEFYSDIYNAYDTYNGKLEFYLKHNLTPDTGYISSGRSYTVIRGYYETDLDTSISISSNNLDMQTIVNNSFNPDNNGYYPKDEYSILRDLYMAYSSVNNLDDIDDVTDDIKDKSESAHTQEQSYFTQNAQAIQDTGLSNYRFSNVQENGIGSVSHDFMLLWNSLGGFNSVYVFSLTLSLALMILRHAPNAIKSSRRDKEE